MAVAPLPRRLYEEVPFDSRFVGWSGEDESAALAWTCLAGQPWRGTHPCGTSTILPNSACPAGGGAQQPARWLPATAKPLGHRRRCGRFWMRPELFPHETGPLAPVAVRGGRFCLRGAFSVATQEFPVVPAPVGSTPFDEEHQSGSGRRPCSRGKHRPHSRQPWRERPSSLRPRETRLHRDIAIDRSPAVPAPEGNTSGALQRPTRVPRRPCARGKHP